MKKLITIADWAADSLTCQELKSAVEGFLKNAEGVNLSFVVSSPSTIHASFLALQIVYTEEIYGRPLDTVLFVNVDPRLNKNGADFVIFKLKSGIYICGPNAGYNFSLLKRKIDEIFVYRNVKITSQFRSRDVYARICAHLMDQMEDELDLDEISEDIIPNLRGFYIGHIDNFGNIKTTIPLSYFKGKYEYGEIIEIEINQVRKKARFVQGMFAGEVGELIIYPGSSGEKNDPFLEISTWQHFDKKKILTGSLIFKNPSVGEEINFH